MFQANLDGLFPQRDFAIVQVVVNDFLKVLRIKEIDVIRLEHGLKLTNGSVWIFVRF